MTQRIESCGKVRSDLPTLNCGENGIEEEDLECAFLRKTPAERECAFVMGIRKMIYLIPISLSSFSSSSS